MDDKDYMLKKENWTEKFVAVFSCRCRHCGHVWIPKSILPEIPKRCPHCGSPNWKEPPRWRRNKI